MALRNPILLIAVAELIVFGLLCDTLGFWPALLLLIGSSAVGALLLRAQGVTTLTRIQMMLEQGQSPVSEIIDALWLAAAGVLLFLPGFLTTLAGLTLLVPLTRRLVGGWLIGRYRAYAGGSPICVHAEFQGGEAPAAATPPGASLPERTTTVIDVEFEDLPPKP